MPSPEAIDAEMRLLHGGPNGRRLSELHRAAADLARGAGARRFHLTHAWVHALEAGGDVGALEAELRRLGGL